MSLTLIKLKQCCKIKERKDWVTNLIHRETQNYKKALVQGYVDMAQGAGLTIKNINKGCENRNIFITSGRLQS